MALKIRNFQKILFIGDSITDCGRKNENAPLGNGYVKLFHDMVAVRQPEKNIKIINRGIGGNNTEDLKTRWTDDVIKHRPDWLSVKIGINDLHRFLRENQESITPEDFAKNYDDILARTKKRLPKCKILLIEPFYISNEISDSSFRNEVLKTLPEYIKTVRDMSKKYNTMLIKTHDMFKKLLKYHDSDLFCAEPVHPNMTGHLAIAEAVYNALNK